MSLSFSIIIPTFNEADNIYSCLQALQVYKHNCEIIMVDGGSTDNTTKIALPLVDKIIISAKGRARQMNTGAKHARGKMLIFLHADTFLPEQALKLIPLSHLWGRFDIQLQGQSRLLIIISIFMNWRSRLTGISTGDQTLFINKTLFDKVNGYSDIALMEDIDLCSKLKKLIPPLCLKAKVTSSARRWEKFGLLKTVLLMWSLRLRFFFGETPEKLSILYSKGLFTQPKNHP